MAEIIYKDISYLLNGIFYNVHNKLGKFCNHDQYCKAIEILLKENNIRYKREIKIPIDFEGSNIEGNQLDFLIKDIIVIDVKAKKNITKQDYIQMQRYLKTTNCKLGIIVNFREESINPKRIINSQVNRAIRI